MHCEKVMQKFNDLLDRTLSAKEEYELQAHLALCPDCRNEFQLVKKADDILRATVLEMVSEIDVPSHLSQRIGQVLAGEKKGQSRKAKLFGFFQAPAFAASMLVLVALVGFFGYNKLFESPLDNPAVVMSVPQNQPASDASGEAESAPIPVTNQGQSSVKDGITTEAPYRAASPLSPTTAQATDSTAGSMPDAGSRSAKTIDRQNVPLGQGDIDSLNLKEKAAAGLVQDAGIEERSKPMVSSQSSGDTKLSMSIMAAPRQGNLPEAASDVGFTPAVPGYLPSGAELKDVTWLPGAVSLEYRAESNYFKITQSRAAEVFVTGEEGGRIIELNGAKAWLQEANPTRDQMRGYTTVRWQYGEWAFTVGGDLPREEILKIALSIK